MTDAPSTRWKSGRPPGSGEAGRGRFVSHGGGTRREARSFRDRVPVLRFVAAAVIASMIALGSVVPRPTLAQQAANPERAGATDVWLEAGFEPAAVYVQAQAIYTLRLYQAIDVRELRFEVPRPALGELRPLDGRVDEATRDGHRYRVTERRFAVVPFASGDFDLPGVHVSGLVAVRGGAAPGGRAPLKLDAPRATLSVLPIPTEAGADPWLPARALSAVEAWTPAATEVRAGHALRRTIRIEARGVDAAQLPALELSAEGLSAHPEPPRLANRFDDEGIVGTREQSWRIVPSRAGELVAPELRLPWWDAVAGRARVATLPARKLLVAGGSRPEAPPAMSEPSPNEPASVARLPAASDTPRVGGPKPKAALAVATLVAVLALAVFALAGVALRRGARAGEPLRSLSTACRRNDPRGARDALLRHAATRWPAQPPRSLGELAARLPDRAARDAVAALDRHLYRGPGGDWDGRSLLGCAAALRNAGRSRTSRRAAGLLPPLYRS